MEKYLPFTDILIVIMTSTKSVFIIPRFSSFG